MNGAIRKLCVLLVTVQCAIFMSAQEAVSPALGFDFGLANIGAINLEMYAGVKGFELVPGVPSRALVYLGGGRVGDAYYRDTNFATQVDTQHAKFNKWNAIARLGLDLGIVYDQSLQRNSVYGLFFVKSFFDSYISDDANPPAIFASGLADNTGAWETSLFAGLFWDKLVFNPRLQSRSGFATQASVEWAPGAAFNNVLGGADYVRLNSRATVFLPILETGSYGLYLANLLTLDALFGEPAGIPGLARRTTGGFDRRPAPGGLVRGLDGGRHDTYLKFINNIDLRFNFLPLFSLPASPQDSILVPELFMFFDAGLIDKLDWRPGQWLASCGGGVILNLRIFGIKADFGYYVSWSIPENRWNFFNLILGAHHF